MSVDFTVIDKLNLDEKGEPRELETHSFSVSETVHSNLHKNIALYGLSKFLQDRTSETPTGPDKLAAMKEVAALLASGEWARERKVGAPVVSPAVEALARLKNCSVGDIQTVLRRYKDKEKREKILSHPKVVELAKQILAEREANADVLDLENV
jgi:hypothetical protein